MRFPFVLKNEAEFDVIGFGTNAVDYLIQVPEYPAFDSKIELNDYTQAAGGEVATTMVGLRRLGRKTTYVGRFGKDAAGDFGMANLREEGVDISFAEQVDGARTQIAFIIIDQRTGERTVIWKRDEKLGFAEDEIRGEIVKKARVLHFTPHDTRACIKLAKAAKDDGVIVSIDIDNVFDGIGELLPLVDVLIASSDFPRNFLGIDDHRSALAELNSKFGCGIVGITLGSKGSLVLCADEYIVTNGFEVPNGCKDTTGAGDSFRAGFLNGLLKGNTVEESARMANAVAALKCREIGARTALPNPDELRALLTFSN
ncbi:MAG: carbohydrate kinase family protein [Acidobacteria bacterium]|nr:carbohydrate kinase family protein [Acidobacteriota bacterium]